MMLEKESGIEAVIKQFTNPLKLALQYSMTGNYIDFGTMNVVNEEYLQQLLKTVEERPVSEKVYLNMRNDLSVAKKLMFITDNCGEIVLDKVLIKTIKEQ